LPRQTLYEYAPCCGGGTLTGIAYSDGTPAVTFAFDRLGRQLSAITAGVSTNLFAYDALTLALANETVIAFGETNVLTRTQDTLGRPAGFEVGRGVPAEPSPYAIAYGYDAYGRLHSVSSLVSSVLSVANYSYLPGSHLLASVSNNLGMVASRTYEPHRDLIAAVSNTFGGTLVSAFDYTNDAIGRRTARIDAQPALNPVQNVFGYNSRSEVQSALMGTNNYGYVFDPIGNRIVATNNAVATAYLVNELNQYTNILRFSAPPREDIPTHDADGNMTYLPSTSGGGAGVEGWYLQWNGENRLILASNDSVRVSYAYDHQGRMFWKQVSRLDSEAWTVEKTLGYLWDDYNIIRETATTPTATNVTYNVWGLDLSGTLQGAGGIGGLLSVTTSALDPVTLQPSNPVTSFPAFDANGNVTEYLSTDGTIVAHYEYSPFGKLTVQSGDLPDSFTHRFSTKPWCAVTALVEYEYRKYSPGLGRWVSRDPIAELGIRAFRLDPMLADAAPHRFLANSPIGNVDFLGLYRYDDTPARKCTPQQREAIDKAAGEMLDTLDKILEEEKYRKMKMKNPLLEDCEDCFGKVYKKYGKSGLDSVWTDRLKSQLRNVRTHMQLSKQGQGPSTRISVRCEDDGESPCKRPLDGKLPGAYRHLDTIVFCPLAWANPGEYGGLGCILLHEVFHVLGVPGQDLNHERRNVEMTRCIDKNCKGYGIP